MGFDFSWFINLFEELVPWPEDGPGASDVKAVDLPSDAPKGSCLMLVTMVNGERFELTIRRAA